MADALAFECLCQHLEQESSLGRLEARGTVLIVLKQAGLDARTATAEQLSVVVEKLLPDELRSRGIDDADRAFRKLIAPLAALAPAKAVTDSPEAVFERLSG